MQQGFASNWYQSLPFLIQELRRNFSGAVPLGDQEKFSKAMLQLKQDKERMESQNKVVRKLYGHNYSLY